MGSFSSLLLSFFKGSATFVLYLSDVVDGKLGKGMLSPLRRGGDLCVGPSWI